MKKTRLFLQALSAILVMQIAVSCNSTKSIAVIKKQSLFTEKGTNKLQPTLFTVNTDATQRLNVIMADSSGRFRTFSENPPDAAIQSVLSILGNAKVDNKSGTGAITAEAKLDFAKTIAELGKRTEAINFQRDGLFRLSEMYNNGAIDGLQLTLLVDSLQRRTVEIAKFASQSEKESLSLQRLKELNKLFSITDSTAPKPKPSDIIDLLTKF